MAVRWFTEEEYRENMSLPWLRDYLKKFKGDTQEREVVGLSVSDNGILVITYQWKAFIFAREKRARQLREAIPVWLELTEPMGRLIAKPVKGEKFQIGIDDEFVDSYWEETDEGKYSRVDAGGCTRLTGDQSKKESSDLNPFLPGTTPARSTPRKRNSKPSGVQQEGSTTV